MSIAILFAGQGSQFVGMGKDFYDQCFVSRKVFDSIQMDFDVKEVCFHGPEEILNNTAYTQSCILACSMAIYEAIKEKGIQPDYVAGLSLGEYSALCASHVFSLEDGLEIVRKRGLIMANALEKNTTKMVAILNAKIEDIQQACQQAGCSIANYNSPFQIVITGTNESVDLAVSTLKEKGVRRMIPLKVSGAFHSPLLEKASQELNEVLHQYPIQNPEIPVIFNVTGKMETENIVDLLTRQIKSSVLFYQSIEYMISQGVDTFIEIGPGHTLSGLVKKTNKNVKVFSIHCYEDIKELSL
ncbi:ACP S-malonyltransferase [Floccifex sp.]|uniref:ACP S-malonyltransferase n=1 Tax=Floccifex sp. TaxID=2815810 RepID=UPI003F0F48D1